MASSRAALSDDNTSLIATFSKNLLDETKIEKVKKNWGWGGVWGIKLQPCQEWVFGRIAPGNFRNSKMKSVHCNVHTRYIPGAAAPNSVDETDVACTA